MVVKELKVDTGAAAKAKARRKDRLVDIPPCEDRERRELLESDDIEWLMYYFGPESECQSPFTYDFVEQQRALITAVGNAVRRGGDAAAAMSRGEGKTTLCERLLIKFTAEGLLKFPVLFQSTGDGAENSLEEIKTQFETNPRLAADYPEICIPVQALECIPQKARTMLVSGHRHDTGEAYVEELARFSWCGREITLPHVPGSPSSGSVIATRGLDAAVRGLKRKGKRPDFALIDDPDTEETATSEAQAKKLEKKIDRGIAALGGQKRRIARVIITTIQSRISVSFKFTDPKEKPSWHGRRHRFLKKPPDNVDLWLQYIILKKEDYLHDTRKAHEFYLANRAAMEAGAEVSNPNRFTAEESSALEFYFSEVARIGQEAVDTEYDNNPAEDSGPGESDLTAHRIQRQISGFDRLFIPDGCTVLSQGIDVGKQRLHWVVRAWRPDCVGFTIDYGVHEIHGTERNVNTGVDVAIHRAILDRMEIFNAEDYCFGDGSKMSAGQTITMVDCRYQTDAVKRACWEAGSNVFPLMAFGRAKRHGGGAFKPCKRTPKSQPGERYNVIKEGAGKILIQLDADYWKKFEHDRWRTGPDENGNPDPPGRLFMWGKEDEKSQRFGVLSRDQRDHHSYARHVTNEYEVEEVAKDGSIVRKFKCKATNVHWLDASAYSDTGVCIRGISLMRPAAPRPKAKKKHRAKVVYGG